MNTAENYSEEEWQLISSLPQLVGLSMSGVGSSGLIGTTKEMFANVRNFQRAKKEFEGNSLIQSILPDTSNPSQAMDKAKQQREALMNRMKENNIKSPAELSEVVLKDAQNVVEIMAAKESPEVVSQYKNWLLGLAEEVANSAKEGDFLGFGGQQFSDKEKVLFDRLKQSLA